MGDAYETGISDPVNWIVVFCPTTTSRLVRYLVPGKFKHVLAIAYLQGVKAWLTFDVGLDRAKVMVIPDGPQVAAVLAPWLEACTLVRMTAKPRGTLPVFGWCVPAISHLLGMSGVTLRPDTLYRHCLRDGGTIINGRFCEGRGRTDTSG